MRKSDQWASEARTAIREELRELKEVVNLLVGISLESGRAEFHDEDTTKALKRYLRRP